MSWEFAAAESEFRRAIDLNPNAASVHNDYAIYLRSIGRLAEAQEQSQRAVELDPTSSAFKLILAQVFYSQRQYNQATDEAQTVLEVDPDNTSAHLTLAMVYRVTGMYSQAGEELQKYYSDSGFPQIASALNHAYAHSGRKGLLLKNIEYASISTNLATYFPGLVAADYAELGEKEKAFAWLEQSYREHAGLQFLKVDPVFDNLRPDPRFDDLLHRIGFPE